MKKYPTAVKNRDDIDLKLGIKSSLKELKALFSLTYVLYEINGRKSELKYCEEKRVGTKTTIQIPADLLSKIHSFFATEMSNKSLTSIEGPINKNPIYIAQYEALLVSLELFSKISKIAFVGGYAASHERTGGNRHEKILKFTTNIDLVSYTLSDVGGSIFPEVKNQLLKWILMNDAAASSFSDNQQAIDKISSLFTIFSEETKFKIRDTNGEVIFQQEGIYEEILNGNTVIESDPEEDVGPFRILASFIRNDFHKFLTKDANNGFSLKPGTTMSNLKEYAGRVSNYLDLLPKKTTIYQDVATVEVTDEFDSSKVVAGQDLSCKEFIRDTAAAKLKFNGLLVTRFIASLCTKPFVILTGLSGSGKTKIAQAFSSWITHNHKPYSFRLGEEIQASRSTYLIIDIDKLGVLISQSGSNTKTLLPHTLITSWVTAIKSNNYTTETPSQIIQEKVIEYSPTLNSFHAPLKALAFAHIKNAEKLIAIKQTCLVPVGADWTNREPLLGFPNALEHGKYIKPENGAIDLIIEAAKPENSNLPFFLILDEMNLSHVERYFADFLSAIESEEPITLHPDTEEWKNEDGSWKGDIPDRIKLPKNLFIVGTVNIDETTYMFSPKVLDRANVIEFRVSETEMNRFLDNPAKPDIKSLSGVGVSMAASFVNIAQEEIKEYDNKEEINEALLKLFNELKKTGAEFGYRTASEIYRFAGIMKKLTENDGASWSTNDIIDAAVMQKLLPKLHGSRKKLVDVLETLSELCINTQGEEGKELLKKFDDKPDSINNHPEVKFEISLEKILRMKKRVIEDGFTSFAEA